MSKERYEWYMGTSEIIDNKTKKFITQNCTELLNQQSQQISDLEAKLAESKQEILSNKNTIANLTHKVRKEAQNALDNFNRIKELEQQLAEFEKFMKDNEWNSIEEIKETLNKCEERYFTLQVQLISKDEQCRECKHLNKKVELNIKNKLMAENSELQQQLADKEKENTKLKEVVDCVDKLKLFNLDIKEYALVSRNAVDEIYCEHQDEISFAVEQLEKVKRTFIDVAWEDVDFAIEIIDNQIKQLKEGK